MNVVNIIIKKKNGQELSDQEINYLVKGYNNGDIPDYQMSAFLMAVCFKGMTKQETASLTSAMINTGEVLNITDEFKYTVDKHSTGGVGDTTSLIVGPIVAAAGCTVAKMSGRGLGHTGGTLDKLESFPGFSIEVSKEQFIKQLHESNIAIIGQTAELAPVDKKMYALRDVTATVDSIPLIASSIMSKKIASGAPKIVLDVKVGSGAFMKDLVQAKQLALTMVNIGKSLNREVVAVISQMQHPLGVAVGNILEIKEAIDFLNGKYASDLYQLCIELSMQILLLAGKCQTKQEALAIVKQVIDSKQALHKLAEMVKLQGGDASYVYDPSRFKKAPYIAQVRAPKDGYLCNIDALKIGKIAMDLGAGRLTKKDKIDLTAGVKLNKQVGDYINKGDVLAYLHTSKEHKLAPCSEMFMEAIKLTNEKVEPIKAILDVVC
ncbi:thymidine phosphorylase [Clostridium sp. 'deep sea']|uniref:thymidine phosphorylase n=1 Tax=Clostridium sp. 'deep sea' TaxID=2779445 RepID=UPI0018965DD5|nr:thymidine phosphorylase [Clostridium sp. 'deep sea']QOR35828.1 thymidine phosphorylase [Clostridium sp. 'deep sea']